VGAVSGYEDVSLVVAFCLVFGGLLLAREAQASTIIVVEEFGFFVKGKKTKGFVVVRVASSSSSVAQTTRKL
jgi:hypothetical protein